MKEGYKKTEFGEIPIDWEVRKLDEFSISSSYGPRFSAELYDENGNCRVIRGTDVIENGKVDYEGIPYANISNEVLEKHRLIENDFVVITTADCGVSFVFDTRGVFMPSAYMVRIRFNDKINPYFVNKFFSTKIIKRQVEKHIRKGTIANLPGSDLLKFKICIPPILEQKKIVEILSTVDSLIKETDKLIEKTDELKKELMKRLLTKGIGHKDFKMTEIGEIPLEWRVTELQSLYGENIRDFGSFSTTKLIEYVKSGIPYLRSENFRGNRIVLDTISYITDEVDLLLDKSYVNKGNILFTKIGNIGCAYLYNGELGERCNSNATIAKISIDNEKCDSQYIVYYLVSTQCKKQYVGSIISTPPRINMGEINKLKIALPNLKEQKQIASILSSVDFQIEEYENKKAKLEELKKGLIQQLLTGKIRIK